MIECAIDLPCKHNGRGGFEEEGNPLGGREDLPSLQTMGELGGSVGQSRGSNTRNIWGCGLGRRYLVLSARDRDTIQGSTECEVPKDVLSRG